MLVLSLLGAALVISLGWNLHRQFAADRLKGFVRSRERGSQLVTHAEFVDGNRHLLVSLALTPATLYYENEDMQASLDLKWIEDVDYEDDPVMSEHLGEGRILRLRSTSQAFVFLLPVTDVPRWKSHLPARRGQPLQVLSHGCYDLTSEQFSRAEDDGWIARSEGGR